jgi:hypothetical protein
MSLIYKCKPLCKGSSDKNRSYSKELSFYSNLSAIKWPNNPLFQRVYQIHDLSTHFEYRFFIISNHNIAETGWQGFIYFRFG